MKKKILGVVTAIAIAATVTFNLNISADTNELSALTIDNIEALASGESGPGDTPCYTGKYDSTLPEALKCSKDCDVYDHVGGEVDKC